MDVHADDTGETLEAVLAGLADGNICPCYLIYGEDEYRVGDALTRIADALVLPADRDLNLFQVDGEREDLGWLCESLLTAPLIPGRKVIVVRNTQLFHSRATLAELIRKIRDNLDDNAARAASCFMQFLKITGWTLDELSGGGWRKITDDEWRATVPGDDGEDREQWFPRIVDFCAGGKGEVKEEPDRTDRLCEILTGGLPPGNHLILTAMTADKRKRLFKVISEVGKVLHFPLLKGGSRQKQALMTLAAELLVPSGKKMSPGAWLALGEKTGFQLREALAAVEKLVSYTGARTTIEERDVEEAVGTTKEERVFDLTALVAEKKLDKSLVTLTHLLEQGVHHLPILSMLAREIRFLLYAKIFIMSGKLPSFRPEMDYGRFQRTVYPTIKAWIAPGSKKESGLAGQHPYAIYLALKNSARFSRESLLRAMEELLEIDIAFKTTAKEPKLMLERFLTRVCLG
ncbi:MAG: hypothetical protein HY742_10680 [Deltaproteobacteria bacterium]|nr:hypothetical protein [Deltaproteobacteria bacterium]